MSERNFKPCGQEIVVLVCNVADVDAAFVGHAREVCLGSGENVRDTHANQRLHQVGALGHPETRKPDVHHLVLQQSTHTHCFNKFHTYFTPTEKYLIKRLEGNKIN